MCITTLFVFGESNTQQDHGRSDDEMKAALPDGPPLPLTFSKSSEICDVKRQNLITTGVTEPQSSKIPLTLEFYSQIESRKHQQGPLFLLLLTNNDFIHNRPLNEMLLYKEGGKDKKDAQEEQCKPCKRFSKTPDEIIKCHTK